MRENNFGSMNGEKNTANSIKTPIFNVYYSQNSEQLKETLSQIRDRKNTVNESDICLRF